MAAAARLSRHRPQLRVERTMKLVRQKLLWNVARHTKPLSHCVHKTDFPPNRALCMCIVHCAHSNPQCVLSPAAEWFLLSASEPWPAPRRPAPPRFAATGGFRSWTALRAMTSARAQCAANDHNGSGSSRCSATCSERLNTPAPAPRLCTARAGRRRQVVRRCLRRSMGPERSRRGHTRRQQFGKAWCRARL